MGSIFLDRGPIPFEIIQHFGDRIAAEFFAERIRKNNGKHRFANDAGRRHCGYIRSFKRRDVFLFRFDIDRTKRFAKRGYRLQVAADAKFLAVRDAAFESAGAVSSAYETSGSARKYL